MAKLFQFSIRSLLVAVTIAAVGIAALLNANVWWEGAAWLVALGLLAVGILLCVYRREQQRAYWLGFVIFGGLYLGLLLFAALLGKSYELAPSGLLQLAYEKIIPDARRSEYSQLPGTGSPIAVSAYTYQVFATPQTGAYTSPPPPAYQPPPLPAPSLPSSGTVPALMPAPAYVSNPTYIPVAKFVSIGHSLWLLLIAAIGGKICQWVFRTQPRSNAGT